MRTFCNLLAGMASLATLLTAGCSRNGDRDGAALDRASASIEDEMVVTLDAVPAAVRATIDAQLNGGTIDEIERSEKDGAVRYEVDIEHTDGDFELVIAADGTLLGRAIDDGDDHEDDDGEANDDEDDDENDDDE